MVSKMMKWCDLVVEYEFSSQTVRIQIQALSFSAWNTLDGLLTLPMLLFSHMSNGNNN